MPKSQYNQKYIAKCKEQINYILQDEKEFDDWTQIAFSMKDAVHAVATIYGCSTDEEVFKLQGFILEMLFKGIVNMRNFDITFKKKENFR